ncbi:uncharacterized protein LOC123322446 [Coccinella septempunctata]|uniref:uncharacterized protein LOC123322446 n=1 Tax=Coccinella septempunctata TaxID=41139 RepID=UPI001D07C7D4|nr:uncharacterized protein LOC123322446 [Coccinella septempunctata]
MHCYWITLFFLCSMTGDQTVTTVTSTWLNSFINNNFSISSMIGKTSIVSSHPGHVISSEVPPLTEKYLKNQLQNGTFERGGVIQFPIHSNHSEDNTFKETSVINENITHKFSNMSDNQVNANFPTDFNGTDINMTYIENATRYEKSWLLNTKQMNVPVKSGPMDMSSLEIIGIFLCCVFLIAIFCSIGYFLYNNRGFNRPEVLNDHCSNPDSSGYLDDTSVRENSEEMYSLDNDSFLNSLEAMTIQNYWTDTVKHTKL